MEHQQNGTEILSNAVPETCHQCECGNYFMDDAIFCRKCGVKRSEVAQKQKARRISFTLPVDIQNIEVDGDASLRGSDASLRGSDASLRDSTDSSSSYKPGNSKNKSTSSYASNLVAYLLPHEEIAQEVSDDDMPSHLDSCFSIGGSSLYDDEEEAEDGAQRAQSATSTKSTEGVQKTPNNRRLSNYRRGPSWEGGLNTAETPRATSTLTSFAANMRRRHHHASDLPSLCTDTRFRVLDRNGPFYQSKGHWAINNVRIVSNKRESYRRSVTMEENEKLQERKLKEEKESARELNELHARDFYHTFLDAPISYQLGCFAIAYMAIFLGFACLYLLIDEPCGLELKGHFIRAYLLSLETMTTIGYGVPDPYMNGCRRGAVILTMQSFIALLMGALLIGVIFQRLSRPQSRASTILFSNKAVIQEINGVLYFMFRVCDLRIRHALIEPHVRCYCLWRHPQRGYEMVPLRLEHPDDTLGAPLVLTLPAMIVHRIDAWSPLAGIQSGIERVPSDQSLNGRNSSPRYIPMPKGPKRMEHSHLERTREQQHLRMSSWPGAHQRQADCEAGGRDSCLCPTCGSTFGTAAMLELHCRYNAAADKVNNISPEACHHELTDDELQQHTHEDPTRERVEEFLSKVHIEVIVLIEGIEPTTSSTLQARHSYMVGTRKTSTEAEDDEDEMDIEWDREFVECCKVVRDESKGLVIDLAKFNETVDPNAFASENSSKERRDSIEEARDRIWR